MEATSGFVSLIVTGLQVSSWQPFTSVCRYESRLATFFFPGVADKSLIRRRYQIGAKDDGVFCPQRSNESADELCLGVSSR